MAGRLGRGGWLIKLNNVNGPVAFRYSCYGRPVSPVTNLLSETPRDENGTAADINREVSKGVKEHLNKELHKELSKEITKEVARSQKQIAREASRASREAARAAREAERTGRVERVPADGEVAVRREPHRIEQESKVFTVTGAPRVRLETFDGPITVHTWDKPEVAITVSKRANDDREMQGISLRAEQVGDIINIVSHFDKSYSREVRREGERIISFSSGASVHYDVYVPRRSSLVARSGDGRLRVDGLQGDVELRTGDGSIDVSGVRGRLSAQTGDGRIQIADFEGDAEARTGDGSIRLDGRFLNLNARTGDGSITLSLPADSNAAIETESETVNSDGVAVPEDTDTPEDREKRVRRWRIGRGGNLFTLRTGDGQIVLRQR